MCQSLTIMHFVLLIILVTLGFWTEASSFKEKCSSIEQAKAWWLEIPKFPFGRSLFDEDLPDLETEKYLFFELLLADWKAVDNTTAEWFLHKHKALEENADSEQSDTAEGQNSVPIKGFILFSPEVSRTCVVLWDKWKRMKVTFLQVTSFPWLCEMFLRVSDLCGGRASIEPLDDNTAEQVRLRVQELPTYQTVLSKYAEAIARTKRAYASFDVFLIFSLGLMLFFGCYFLLQMFRRRKNDEHSLPLRDAVRSKNF